MGVSQTAFEDAPVNVQADVVGGGYASEMVVGQLFDTETNPIQLIKHKELLEVLEMATDKAEDAANVLETVVLKSA